MTILPGGRVSEGSTEGKAAENRALEGSEWFWPNYREYVRAHAQAQARNSRHYLPTLPIIPIIIKKGISSMTSPNSISGRIAADASDDGSITFEGVQERLVEAWGFLRRMPDREAGWLMDVRASSIYERGQLSRQELWELYQIDSADYDRDALPRMPGLRSVEVDRMEQALGWMGWVDARDRKLVGIILGQLERGSSRPAWTSAAKTIGWAGHTDTLAKRYSRAITRIATKLDNVRNGCSARLEPVKP